MPDWLPKLLVGFPAVVVMGGILWYAVHWLTRQTERELARAEVMYTRGEANTARDHAAHLASKDQEISRLRDDIREETRAVGRKVDAHARKLS